MTQDEVEHEQYAVAKAELIYNCLIDIMNEPEGEDSVCSHVAEWVCALLYVELCKVNAEYDVSVEATSKQIKQKVMMLMGAMPPTKAKH